MNTPRDALAASLAPTMLHADVNGRKLAYRTTGTGKPLVLCNRFRGTLDLWDPAFLQALAAQGYQVITFDYSGLGQSTGEKSYNPVDLALDAKDLIEALGLTDLAIGGWSIGGIAAQILLTMIAPQASHLVLLATTPPGQLVKPGEQLFYDTAAIPGIDLDQFTTVFFEPADAASVEASKRSFDRIMAQMDPKVAPVPVEWAMSQIGSEPRNPLFPADQVLAYLKLTDVPILHLGGDHDIVMPIENWYALNQALPTLTLVTYPRAGHAPHHQHPEMAAEQIGAFLRHIAK